MKAKTFRDAYGVLQRHAQTLREQDEPNIDDLLAIVTESAAAYKVCQERIAAVEQALEKALGAAADCAAPGAGQVRVGGTDASRRDWNADAGDVPF